MAKRKRCWAALVVLMLLSGPASAQVTTMPIQTTIPLTNSYDPETQIGNLILERFVNAVPGEVYLIIATAEASAYQCCPETTIHLYPFFVTSGVYAMPGLAPLQVQNPWARPPGVVIAPALGQDLWVGAANYYEMINRVGVYVATGPFTVGLYAWGGSSDAAPGDVAWIFPGTTMLSVTRLR